MSYRKEDPDSIQKMFGTIAKSYDRTNSILSFGLHKYWNRMLVDTAVAPFKPQRLLDLCCGTGEIALTYLRNHPDCRTYMLDFCPEMLQCARSKSANFNNIEYLQADAQEIPLENNSVTCATIAYGIRNVKDPAKAIAEVYRVLQPGGSFGILELTRPEAAFLKAGHQFYLKKLFPILGYCLTPNKEAYRYLCNSIHSFVKPEELKAMMIKAGFKDLKIVALSCGVATILHGQKPKNG